jgi:hypothetical protein
VAAMANSFAVEHQMGEIMFELAKPKQRYAIDDAFPRKRYKRKSQGFSYIFDVPLKSNDLTCTYPAA